MKMQRLLLMSVYSICNARLSSTTKKYMAWLQRCARCKGLGNGNGYNALALLTIKRGKGMEE